MGPLRAVIAVTLFLCVATGCTDDANDGGSRVPVRVTPLDRVLAWDSPIEMEETDSVVIVLPNVTVENDGGFLVTDFREQVVSRYTSRGELDFRFGRRGDGPAEFRLLQTAVRLPSGKIVTLESNGHFKIVSEDGSELLEDFSVAGFQRASQMAALSDSTLLVAARLAGSLDREQLHIVNLDRHTVSRSFFEPFAEVGSQTAAFTAGWVGFDIRGDTVAATFSVSDSVYYFDAGGTRLGALPLPSSSFRVVEGEPDEDARQLPRRRAEWLASFDLVERPWFVADGLLVSYQELVPSEALEREHHLVLMQLDGEKVWEVRSTPRLLAIVDDRLLFISPSSLLPNQWQFARFITP